MRLMNITCVLLAATICCVAVNAAATGKEDKTISPQESDTTTAIPPKNPPSIEPVTSHTSNITTNPSVKNNSSGTINSIGDGAKNVTSPSNSTRDVATSNSSVPPVPSTTILPDTKGSSKPSDPSISNKTTSQPISSTTAKDVTTRTTPTTESTPNKNAITTIPNNPSSAVPSPATTVVPVSTNVAPPSPSKERHFDGLSFLGGIILATSLMAIGVLSWKFYRTFNERNYRTL